MVFLPTARQTGYLATLFNSIGIEVLEIHSRKSQVDKNTAIITNKGIIMISVDIADTTDNTITIQRRQTYK
jgi:hypothetical protein